MYYDQLIDHYNEKHKESTFNPMTSFSRNSMSGYDRSMSFKKYDIHLDVDVSLKSLENK